MSPSNTVIVLLVILTVATYSLVGLLAIWAGLGRPHWFLRVAVVGGTVLLLLLIPAYEPLLLFSIQSAVVVLPLMVLKAVRKRSQHHEAQGGATTRLRPQFSLSDLLLLTVVVAVIVAVLVNIPSDTVQITADSTLRFDVEITPAVAWATVGLCGLGFGISTLAAAWVVLGRRRLWLRLIVLCLTPTSAALAAWLALVSASGWLARRARRGDSSLTACAVGGATNPMLMRLARLATVLLSLLILLPPAATLCVLVAPAPDPPQIILPDPNGYQELLKAAKVLKDVTVPDADTATAQQLRAFFTRYGHVLDAARNGLDRECIVPLEYPMSDLEDIERLQSLRQLAHALRSEGELAESQGRPADAVESYLDLIRLGQAGSRGGMVVDWWEGQALNAKGVAALTDLLVTLTPEQCREVMDTLEMLNASRESLEDAWVRDELWERIASDDWTVQLMRKISMIAGSKSYVRPALQNFEDRNQAKLRLLICGLALRSYCVENGQPPEKLADLVPGYLPEVPRDPYSGKPLAYRRTAKGYVLYSVGSDRCDDGGQPGNNLESGTDILLDWAPQGQEE